MKWLTIGRGGFIGWSIAARLTDEGHWVIMLDDFTRKDLQFIVWLRKQRDIRFIRDDVE